MMNPNAQPCNIGWFSHPYLHLMTRIHVKYLEHHSTEDLEGNLCNLQRGRMLVSKINWLICLQNVRDSHWSTQRLHHQDEVQLNRPNSLLFSSVHRESLLYLHYCFECILCKFQIQIRCTIKHPNHLVFQCVLRERGSFRLDGHH